MINYLCSMIPIKPPPSWFKSLDSIISKFYWKNKKPRIKLDTLKKFKSQGGLEAPNFSNYFTAHQLQYIHKWINTNQSDSTWIDIEQTLCKEIHISDLPFIGRSITHHPCFKNSAIATALSAWWNLHQITNTTISPSKHTAIWNNPDFIINKKHFTFQHGLAKASHTSNTYFITTLWSPSLIWSRSTALEKITF